MNFHIVTNDYSSSKVWYGRTTQFYSFNNSTDKGFARKAFAIEKNFWINFMTVDRKTRQFTGALDSRDPCVPSLLLRSFCYTLLSFYSSVPCESVCSVSEICEINLTAKVIFTTRDRTLCKIIKLMLMVRYRTSICLILVFIEYSWKWIKL